MNMKRLLIVGLAISLMAGAWVQGDDGGGTVPTLENDTSCDFCWEHSDPNDDTSACIPSQCGTVPDYNDPCTICNGNGGSLTVSVGLTVEPITGNTVNPNICIGASSPFDVAKFKASVCGSCSGTGGGAIVTVGSGDVTVNPSSVTDGTIVTVTPTASASPGSYTIYIQHQNSPLCTSSAGGTLSKLVEITGFTVNPTYALGQGCDVNKHKSTCQVSVCTGTATFSIQGSAHGATIDASTGIITPSSTESGTITVRATSVQNTGTYDEKNLEIRAHPTSISSSQAVGTGAYGGNWTHTFNGTGGSLDGILLSEKVDSQPPDPFNAQKHVQPGLPNVWLLNASGVMNLPDTYHGPSSAIDARQFLPAPPKSGLPVTETMAQYYYWYCRLDAAYQQFMGPNNLNWTLQLNANGDNFIVQTSAYGKHVDDTYVGPAVLQNINISASAIAADGSSTAQGGISIQPTARSVTWSIDGAALGATINAASGLVTAGNQGGQINLQATDSQAAANFLQINLVLVKVENVVINPAAITANGTATAQATATVTPNGRPLTWSIVGNALGCTIDANTGLVKAGTQKGTITIKATDQAVPNASAQGTLNLQ